MKKFADARITERQTPASKKALLVSDNLNATTPEEDISRWLALIGEFSDQRSHDREEPSDR